MSTGMSAQWLFVHAFGALGDFENGDCRLVVIRERSRRRYDRSHSTSFRPSRFYQNGRRVRIGRRPSLGASGAIGRNPTGGEWRAQCAQPTRPTTTSVDGRRPSGRENSKARTRDKTHSAPRSGFVGFRKRKTDRIASFYSAPDGPEGRSESESGRRRPTWRLNFVFAAITYRRIRLHCRRRWSSTRDFQPRLCEGTTAIINKWS